MKLFKALFSAWILTFSKGGGWRGIVSKLKTFEALLCLNLEIIAIFSCTFLAKKRASVVSKKTGERGVNTILSMS